MTKHPQCNKESTWSAQIKYNITPTKTAHALTTHNNVATLQTAARNPQSNHRKCHINKNITRPNKTKKLIFSKATLAAARQRKKNISFLKHDLKK